MKEDWETQRLGDLFTFKNGRAFKKEEWTDQGLPIIRIQNLNREDASFNYFAGEYGQDIFVNPGDLLFSWSGTIGTSFGSHIWSGEPGLLNQHIFKVAHRETISRRYAFYGLRFITAEIEKSVSGAVGLVHITKEKLNEFTLSLPPLPEQQRIVALLDEAFAGLATAKANAEQNLQNARALFESHLQSVFTERGEGWVETALESCCEQIFAGGDVPKDRLSKVRTSQYSVPIYSNGEKDNGLYGFTDIARVAKPSVTVSARGTLGFSVIRTEPFLPVVRLIVLVPDAEQISLPFLYYTVVGMDFGNTGTSIPQLTVPNIKESILRVPPLSEQKTIVEKLDALTDEIQRLTRLYERKLASLEELKKSLLHQAFNGEL
jgi:type I restriction enzyme S subunit